MLSSSLGQKIIVRFLRKPRWMPPAPSKLFRIAEHTFYSKDEVEQIRLLNDTYKAQLVTIREFMKHEFYIPATQAGGLPLAFIQMEQEQDKKTYEENERENQRVAKLKEEYLQKQLKDLEDKLYHEKLLRDDKRVEKILEIDENVRKLKSDPDSIVTPENIEILIEKAIANPKSYEFCINQYGKKFGSKTNSVKQEQDKMA